MPPSENRLSTKAFAEKAGVSAGTVTKWLRSGKIKGMKQSGKWMIDAGELNTVEQMKPLDPKQQSAEKKDADTRKAASPNTISSEKTFTVEQFSAMTYLTESGVLKWARQGKLSFIRDQSGRPRIKASNLENDAIKHLIRRQ